MRVATLDSSTTLDALSTFAALDTLGISFIGWTRRIDDDPWPDNDTEAAFSEPRFTASTSGSTTR